MHPAMYGDLVEWYRFMDPAPAHAEEAACYRAAFDQGITERPPSPTLLELGAGAGNNAAHLKSNFSCTLTDVAPGMLALSRDLNPECTHHEGDMRTLRLDQTFDAVLLHDSVVYMTTEPDLRRALETAFLHTRPGGAAVVAPDYFSETYAGISLLYEADDGDRAMRCLEWVWDPDPNDDTYTVDYAFLLKEGDQMRAVHDRHIEGLFPRATWLRLLKEAGYLPEIIPRPVGDGEEDEVFLCRRPK